MGVSKTKTGAGRGRREVDLLVEPSSRDSRLLVKACDRRAHNWLSSIGDGVVLDHRSVGDFIAAAVRAGFTVAFAPKEPIRSVESLPKARSAR
jgi:hypothetical protein